jgi:hypothetical protein
MNYAFEHDGKGFTPSGVLVAAVDITRHNAEQEENDLARIKAGVPVVVYPIDLPNDAKDLATAAMPFVKNVTLWTGLSVGVIVRQSTFRNPFGFRSTMTAYTWRDHDGHLWHGRGAGNGMSLNSRRSKKSS